MKNRKNKAINNSDFKLVKTLLQAGLSIAKVMEITGRSYQVVAKINKADNLEGYKAATTQNNKPTENGRDLTAYRLTQIKVLLERILAKIAE